MSPKAVHPHEPRGLVEPPEQTAAGHRTDTPDDVVTLQFIRQAKTVGLALDGPTPTRGRTASEIGSSWEN